MSREPLVEDAEARRRIRESLDESLIVEAAAGTGKTTELVNRIVAVLQAGLTTIDRIVAVTFTRKAAGELKLRLRQRIDAAREDIADPGQAERLEDAAKSLEEARVGTIHSFCADLLRERPVEADVDPSFQELDEITSTRLYRRAFRRWLEEKLAVESPALDRVFSRAADGRSPIAQLEGAGWTLVEWRDFRAAWARPAFDLAASTAALIHQIGTEPERIRQSLRPVSQFLTWLERAQAAGAPDAAALEGQLLGILEGLRQQKWHGNRGPAPVKQAREKLIGTLEQFRLDADADLAAALQSEMRSLVDRYDRIKRSTGRLDFLDLLIGVRDLVRDRAGIRNYFQRRFSHIFVDEFQDVDPLQAEILTLLAAADPGESDWRRASPAPGKLFVVGDPKQSIYRFRRADVHLYREVSAHLESHGVARVHLMRSFRSVEPIRAAVNAAFAGRMTGDTATGQPRYVPLTAVEDDDLGAPPGQPAVVALPVPRPYGARGDATKGAIAKCLPDAIAAWVHWLVASSGWTVRDPAEKGRRTGVKERHIAILFRRFVEYADGRRQDSSRAIQKALEARGVAHLLVGGKSFHRREEVETLRTALAAVEWPDDDLSVFATLKGSLFAISDEVLLRYHRNAGTLHPFRPAAEGLDDELQPVVEALEILAGLTRARNRRPVVATLTDLLERTRAHAGFAVRPGGGQILANVSRVLDLARAHELSGGVSFRGFVDQLEEDAEREESSEAPVLEEGADGVRIMTLHSAKGLEFPVVILADMTVSAARRRAERWVDMDRNLCAIELLGCAPRELLEHNHDEALRDEAESVRVAYVAATRARDLLVIPAVGDAPFENGWLAPLNDAIYPPAGRRRSAEKAPGCPDFETDSVIDRPPAIVARPPESMQPGLHRVASEVVWWDPHKLGLNVEGSFGIAQEEILMEGTASGAGRAEYAEWRVVRDRILAQGRRPELDVFTATEAPGLPPGPSPVIEVARVARNASRPAGPRFGTLVHAILRDVKLSADARAVSRLAAIQARIHGATAGEREAAMAAALAALDHPLLQRAAGARVVHREMPVMLRLDDGGSFEGVVDLAFLEDGGWCVIDFKTDAELTLDDYSRQLQWYVYALSRITASPARGWLLSV